MNVSLEEALKEAYASCPASKAIIDTLEIRQANVQSSIFIANHRIGIVALDENSVSRNFIPCGFRVALPPSNEEGFRSLNITLDNIDRRVSDFVEVALTAVREVECLYRPYLSDDMTRPQMNPPLLLFLKDVKIKDIQVTARATFMDLVNKRFPLELYNRLRFPALG